MRTIKYLLVLTLLLMSIGVMAQPNVSGRVTPEHPYNIDRNSVIDAVDVTAFVDSILHNVEMVKGDFNEDGKKDITDVAILIAYLEYRGHEYVDLGLPSGTLWATMNLGASSPEEIGDYYAWGETSTKTSYTWSNYALCNGTGTTLTKYNGDSSYGTVDGLTSLEIADDAANAVWGGVWRLPTKAQAQELKSKCTWTLVSGEGYTVTGPNGNSIFLPLGGYISGTTTSQVGHSGYYWTSNLGDGLPTNTYCMVCEQSAFELNVQRYCGRSIRPVAK